MKQHELGAKGIDTGWSADYMKSRRNDANRPVLLRPVCRLLRGGAAKYIIRKLDPDTAAMVRELLAAQEEK